MTRDVLGGSGRRLAPDAAARPFTRRRGLRRRLASFPFFRFLSSLFHSPPCSATALQPLIKRRKLISSGQCCLQAGTLAARVQVQNRKEFPCRSRRGSGHLTVETQRPCGSGRVPLAPGLLLLYAHSHLSVRLSAHPCPSAAVPSLWGSRDPSSCEHLRPDDLRRSRGRCWRWGRLCS